MTISQVRAELASQRMEGRAGPSFTRVTGRQFILAQKPHHPQCGERARMEPGQDGLQRQCASKDTEAAAVSGNTK